MFLCFLCRRLLWHPDGWEGDRFPLQRRREPDVLGQHSQLPRPRARVSKCCQFSTDVLVANSSPLITTLKVCQLQQSWCVWPARTSPANVKRRSKWGERTHNWWTPDLKMELAVVLRVANHGWKTQQGKISFTCALSLHGNCDNTAGRLECVVARQAFMELMNQTNKSCESPFPPPPLSLFFITFFSSSLLLRLVWIRDAFLHLYLILLFSNVSPFSCLVSFKCNTCTYLVASL